MRISDWSSDVCSSDLDGAGASAMDRGAAALARRTQPRGVRSETRSRLRIRPGPSPPPESLFRMLNLKEYRGTADRLADHLPWAELVAPGVVLNKDAIGRAHV